MQGGCGCTIIIPLRQGGTNEDGNLITRRAPDELLGEALLFAGVDSGRY